MFASQGIYRCLTAASEIMPEAQGMSYFMATHKTNKLSHQFFIKLSMSCPGVCCASLHDIPFMKELQYVMVPADMRLYDLTTSRVMYLGAICVPCFRRQIVDKTVTR